MKRSPRVLLYALFNCDSTLLIFLSQCQSSNMLTWITGTRILFTLSNWPFDCGCLTEISGCNYYLRLTVQMVHIGLSSLFQTVVFTASLYVIPWAVFHVELYSIHTLHNFVYGIVHYIFAYQENNISS